MTPAEEKEWMQELVSFQDDSMLWCWNCEAPLCCLWGSVEEDNLEMENINEFCIYADVKTQEPKMWLCEDCARPYESSQDKGRN